MPTRPRSPSNSWGSTVPLPRCSIGRLQTGDRKSAVLAAARTMADFTIVDLPWASAGLVEEVMQHSTFTALVVERNRIGLHAALAKMTDLRSMTSRPDAVGAVVGQDRKSV